MIERLERAESLVHRAVEQEWRVYGVTTGFGSMAEVPIPAELAAAYRAVRGLSELPIIAQMTVGITGPI